MLRRSAFPLAALLLTAVFAGCGPTFQSVRAIPKSSILVLPSNDAVQNGTWHDYEGGRSGKTLTDRLVDDLAEKGWKVVMTKNPAFTNRDDPEPERQIAEARKLGADYVLYAKLGEFFDAAPMTLRFDFLTLEEATLRDAGTGEVVWRLEEPQKYRGSNFGSFWRFIPKIAADIAAAL